DIIVTETERLSALIENVLNFSQMERGLGAYEFAEANINDVVRRTVSMLQHRASRPSVELKVNIPDTPLHVRMEERAVDIAVNNLVDNAFKCAAGGKSIEVSVKRIGSFAEIVGKDDGPGSAPEDRRRIFERFARGEAQPGSNRPRGSGIGLSLVKSIAEA